ncbi:MAG: hypothetical protein OEM91_14275 [Hyphomicrobiales bacterium]|nr:hypothetical protein [Hyphomicrobiales bacterium]
MLSLPSKSMSAWADRLAVLIKESDYPEADMREAAVRVFEAGLVLEEPDAVNPEKFARLLIEENELMIDRMPVVASSIDDLRTLETVGDLISHLLPSNNALD